MIKSELAITSKVSNGSQIGVLGRSKALPQIHLYQIWAG